MGLNGEKTKNGNEFITKTILAIFLFIIATASAYLFGLTPCKVAISLNPAIEFCQPETPPVIVSVRSDISWQDSGLFVQAGQTLHIIASGSINTWGGNPIGYSPNPNGQTQHSACPSEGNVEDCLINAELYGTLIGKIGENGTPFRIGAENKFPVTTSGNLFLAINDDEPYMEDNSGIYSVSITVK